MQILWFKTREGLGSPPRPADNNSASRYSRRFDSVIQCFAFAAFPQDAAVGIPVVDGHHCSAGPHQLGEQSRGHGPNRQLCTLFNGVLRCSVSGLISVQERQRACDEAFLTMAQGVHDKACPAKIDRAHIIQTMHPGLATRAHLDPLVHGCCQWQAAWQRRTALGFFQAAASTVTAILLRCCCQHRQAMGELFCCMPPSVDADELRL